MKIENLKSNIHLFEKNKIEILRIWLGYENILEILKKYNIDKRLFIKVYALGILECYLGVVKEKNKIGDCPTIDDFLNYLHNKNIKASELFLICAAFRDSLIEACFQFKIHNFEIEKEISFIYEKNFSGVLDKYFNAIIEKNKELEKSTNIVDKYVITSRIDKEGIITAVSEAFCKTSGYTQKELLGTAYKTLFDEETDGEIYKQLWDTIQSGEIWNGELKNKRKDGSIYWVDAIISPVYNQNNKIIAYDSIRQDITAKKELQEQQSIIVEQSKSAAMGEMISMIAHQWRQPLQAVSILTQKLPLNKMVEGTIDDKLLDEVVDGVTIQLEYMSKTIDDFRDFFLPDKPKEFISVIDVINKALEFVNFMLKNDNVKVNLDLKCDKKIELHVNEIIQVLINLFKNARDVLLERDIEDKEINISCDEEKNYIVIRIEDNAGGVPQKLMNKVFEPYFSTKDKKNGTGLGLYMCRTIIEKHSSGLIELENSDKGAVFTVKLPIS